MNWIEILGWIATAGTLISFTMNDMVKLRLIGGSFAILWVMYGFLKMDNPIIVINSSIVMIHLYWFYTNRKGLGAGGESIKEKFIDSSPNSLEDSPNKENTDKLNKIYEKLDTDYMYNWIRGHKNRKQCGRIKR